jgi:hypothetical protein
MFGRLMFVVLLACSGIWAYAHYEAHNSLAVESLGFVVAIIGTVVAWLLTLLFGGKGEG